MQIKSSDIRQKMLKRTCTEPFTDLKSKNRTNDVLHQPQINSKFEGIVVMLVARDRRRGKDGGGGRREKIIMPYGKGRIYLHCCWEKTNLFVSLTIKFIPV